LAASDQGDTVRGPFQHTARISIRGLWLSSGARVKQIDHAQIAKFI
jgi:hypothetical protein